jgi:hypothetical protein
MKPRLAQAVIKKDLANVANLVDGGLGLLH